MRILLTNDDGINAAGFQVLRNIAAQLSDDVWCVAPETDQSGLAHSLTLSHPLRLRELGEKTFALNGTPTDCVIMGVRDVMDGAPDLVLSGVNHGANAGEDVTYSGTVAGAMEGAMLGIPSIALSQACDWIEGAPVYWETAEKFGPESIEKAMSAGLETRTFVNINFPKVAPEHVRGYAIASQGEMEHGLHVERRQDGRSNPYYWLKFHERAPMAFEQSDIEALDHDKIAISPLRANLTNERALSALSSAFGL